MIFRKIDIYEDAKYFGENVQIFFEIPNDYKNCMEDIKILKYVDSTKLTEKGINLSEELTTVASIISMTEKNQIQYNNFEKKFKLSHEESQKIIYKYLKEFGIQTPNYYQINIFIKVLYDSFIKFSNNDSISPKVLPRENLDIRKFIIHSLINFTKNFLEYFKNIMEGKKKKNEIDKLSNIKPISFDQIKPSLIVFTEDGRSINIIATCSKNDKEYSDLEKLYNPQKNKKQQLHLFRELKKEEIINNVKNFLNCNLNDEDFKNLIGNYVYTQDNFIKVVLIMMRIRAKIPIILMGETGCGKTLLIEMASKLINASKESNFRKVTLKKMNIHAEITDKDIIEFFDKIKKEIENEDENIKKQLEKSKDIEKIKKERKIWIFIDEINACNSMRLFVEIFTNSFMLFIFLNLS